MEDNKNKITFTVNEIAEILNVHPETVRRMIRDGRIKALREKKGRASIISKNDL